MEIIEYKEKIDNLTYAKEKYLSPDTLLFDIECTGLSPRKSFVYLIGFAYRKNNTLYITQLLAKNLEDEKNILIEFEKTISNYPNLLGFNSTRFDESFLIERYKLYNLDTTIKSKNHKDIYLSTTKAKCILNLNNYKQKTIENFLGIYRDDKYDGGQLIPVYKDFSETNNPNSKELVLLHNMEDVKGMCDIIDILCYSELLNCDITIKLIDIENDSLQIICSLPFSVPCSINKLRDYGMYIITQNILKLTMPFTIATLNTYLEDFKNYYYLLNEDIIIPKTIGQSIPKENRRNATKRECRVSKEGHFINIPEKLNLPKTVRMFTEDLTSKVHYMLPEDINESIALLIIQYMIKH